MSRVALEVRMPAVFVIGATSELEVIVTAERETHHEGIRVELVRDHVILTQILVSGTGTLAAGTSILRAKLAVPETHPPGAAHAIRARIALPWRIDATFAGATRVVRDDDPVARDGAALVLRTVAHVPVPGEMRTIIVTFGLSQGWTVSDPDSFATVALGRMIAIEKPHATHELAIGVARRGDEDYLVARCAFPRLGVAVALPSPRRPTQVTWPRWLVPVAAPIDVLPAVRITAADDTHVVFEHPITRLTKERLHAVAQVVAHVSREVETARQLIDTPVTCDREGWRVLAKELGGHFAPGDFGITGTLGGMAVTTAFVEPGSLRITVGEYAEMVEIADDASAATVRGHIVRLRELAARAAETGPFR